MSSSKSRRPGGPVAPPVTAHPDSDTDTGVARTYARLAPVYDMLFGQVLEAGRRRMTEVVRQLAPEHLLEVGVGTGLALGGYPSNACIVGIDLSAKMLVRASERAALLPDHRITLEQMNAERMGFPDASFDCVTVPYVLSVTPRPTELIREIRRVCKPEGTIVVLNHFSGSPAWWLLERAVRSAAAHVGFRSDFCYNEQILEHDWRVEWLEPVNLCGLSRLVVLRNRA
jgi:phosphatidylethanolamine/phosphatidyl-N-methylethanolamine N-methyltransferase